MIENRMVLGEYETDSEREYRLALARGEAESESDSDREQDVRMVVANMMRDPSVAESVIADAEDWNCGEDTGPALRSILAAVARHREPASCITAADRMDAMLAEIAGALEGIAGAHLDYERAIERGDCKPRRGRTT